MGSPRVDPLLGSPRRRKVVTRDPPDKVSVDENHVTEFRPADTRGVLQHLPEYRIQLARRTADDLKNL